MPGKSDNGREELHENMINHSTDQQHDNPEKKTTAEDQCNNKEEIQNEKGLGVASIPVEEHGQQADSKLTTTKIRSTKNIVIADIPSIKSQTFIERNGNIQDDTAKAPVDTDLETTKPTGEFEQTKSVGLKKSGERITDIEMNACFEESHSIAQNDSSYKDTAVVKARKCNCSISDICCKTLLTILWIWSAMCIASIVLVVLALMGIIRNVGEHNLLQTCLYVLSGVTGFLIVLALVFNIVYCKAKKQRLQQMNDALQNDHTIIDILKLI